MSDLPADSPAGFRAWLPAAPTRVAAALAAATAYVGAVDPSRRSILPPCPFHAMTGWWCPGCGMTRATHRLLRGDLLGALRYNALLPFVLAFVAVAWLDWYARAVGRRRLIATRPPMWTAGVAYAVAIGFAVVRNLPAVSFLRG